MNPNCFAYCLNVYRDGVTRSFADYRAAVHRDRLPDGVELFDLCI